VTEMQLWVFREESWGGLDLTGYSVEASDGSIGKIDEASRDAYLVVDTGPWIFGKKVMLPVGVIDHIDVEEQKVYVNRDKETIKNSPEFDEKTYQEQSYRDQLGGYYGGLPTRSGGEV
jgi:hypothetical protein